MNKPQAAASLILERRLPGVLYFVQLKNMYVDLGCFAFSKGDSLTYVVSLR